MSEVIAYLLRIDWISLFEFLGTLFTAGIALTALNIWRSQKKADIHTKFLDELTDELHELIYKLSLPLEFLNYFQISIQSHKKVALMNSKCELSGAIEYIEKNGASDSEEFQKHLEPCSIHLTRIRSLVAKGQVLGFNNYQQCRESCDSVTRQFDRLSSLRVFLALGNLNWKNETVQRNLDSILTLNYQEIKEELGNQNIDYLEFLKENYKLMFKET